MGCMKSKQTFPFPSTIERCEPQVSTPVTQGLEDVEEVEEAQVEEAQVAEAEAEAKAAEKPAEPRVVVSEFAHRLSQEILSGALRQWADCNAKYAGIPFIESDGLSVAQR